MEDKIKEVIGGVREAVFGSLKSYNSMTSSRNQTRKCKDCDGCQLNKKEIYGEILRWFSSNFGI